MLTMISSNLGSLIYKKPRGHPKYQFKYDILGFVNLPLEFIISRSLRILDLNRQQMKLSFTKSLMILTHGEHQFLSPEMEMQHIILLSGLIWISTKRSSAATKLWWYPHLGLRRHPPEDHWRLYSIVLRMLPISLVVTNPSPPATGE